MIVWLASYPRSGNTYVRLLLSFGFGVMSANRYGDTRLQLDEVYPYRLELDPKELPRMRDEAGPTFVKTHDVADASDSSPALCIVRDGRDAVVSHARFVLEWKEEGFEGMSHTQALGSVLENENRSPFGEWSANVRAWTRRSGPTAMLRFEELITTEDPVAMVGSAAEELGISLTRVKKPLPAFEDLQAAAPHMFRRGRVGAWRDEMPPELEERFWRLHGAEMRALGYSRDHPPAGSPQYRRTPAR